MHADLDTLVTALYVKVDDEIGGTRSRGRPPLLSDSELVCLAVAQALLGFHSESRWLRYANKYLSGMFRTCRSARATTSGSARHLCWSRG